MLCICNLIYHKKAEIVWKSGRRLTLHILRDFLNLCCVFVISSITRKQRSSGRQEGDLLLVYLEISSIYAEYLYICTHLSQEAEIIWTSGRRLTLHIP